MKDNKIGGNVETARFQQGKHGAQNNSFTPNSPKIKKFSPQAVIRQTKNT